MNIIKKIISGDNAHKSRFHDEKGNVVALTGFRYLPHCLFSTALRLTVGTRPVLPWISYRAIRRLKSILTPQTKMLEFGSGMSTVWYARHCGHVVSIEDHREWYQKISQYLIGQHIKNVDYKIKESPGYHQLSDFENASFDFIMIDGSERAKCVASSIPKLKPKGFIYLDNSDKSAFDNNGDLRIAEKLLLQAVNEKNGKVEYFVDFMPTYFGVTQGMLVQL